jgi:hypothetical protein
MIGVFMFVFLIYELVTGKAYGLWRQGRDKELCTRWHSRTDDPLMYWKLVASRAFFSILLVGTGEYPVPPRMEVDNARRNRIRECDRCRIENTRLTDNNSSGRETTLRIPQLRCRRQRADYALTRRG